MKLRILLVAALLVLVPASMAMAQAGGKDIVEVAVAAGNFKTLAKALEKANLINELKQPGPFTVFAPTDAAFAKVPKETLDSLMADHTKLRSVLLFHVVPGKYMAKDLPGLKECKTLCPTAEGQMLKIQKANGKVTVQGAEVVQADVPASNGVIHVIDEVITPKFAIPKK